MNLFHSFFTKTNEILLRMGEKRAVFPQEPIAAEKLLCDVSECASLAGKLTGSISVQAKTELFYQHYYCLRYRSTDGFSAYPKKEEGRNE